MWTFERRDLAEEEGAIFEDLLISASETGLLEATIPHGPLFCSLKKMISGETKKASLRNLWSWKQKVKHRGWEERGEGREEEAKSTCG